MMSVVTLHRLRRGKALCWIVILLLLPGCFVEKSYWMRPGDVVPLPVATQRQSIRQWLRSAHSQLEHLLPPSARPSLFTEDLTNEDGTARDVFAHFRAKFKDMDMVLANLEGLRHTAAAASPRMCADEPAPPWPGFETVWIPVNKELSLNGRLAFAKENGKVKNADCIVILPGFLGDHGVMRTRDLAEALYRNGFHVLSLELRGCGVTADRYPDIFTSWGIFETDDLLLVDEWLQTKPEVLRTGLIGYCWGSNIALLTAWADGRNPDHPSIPPDYKPYIQPTSASPHFSAGVLAFAPVVRFESLIDELDKPHFALLDPILSGFQQLIRRRMIANGFRPVSTSLRELIAHELGKYNLPFEGAPRKGGHYLRLIHYQLEPSGDKLEDARMPVLIVHSFNDPLVPAQDVADLITTTENPNVAAIILPGGGHVGLAGYSRPYYFSLIINFFDRRVGPVAVGQ